MITKEALSGNMNTYQIDRRQFMKQAALTVAGVGIASSVASCAAAPIAMKSVAHHLGAFALAVGAQVVATEATRWFESLHSNDQQFMQSHLQPMRANGFTNFNTNVFRLGDMLFLGATAADGFNTCVAFFSSKGVPLVEGPVLMGICLAGQDHDWGSIPVHPVDALLPYEAVRATGSAFNRSFTQPFQYKTAHGTLEVAYKADTANKRGVVGLVAKRDNGGLLFGKDYQLKWV